MAGYFHSPLDLYSPVLPNPTFSEDDEMSVLDDKILDPTSSELELSSVSDNHHRHSYEPASDAFLQRDSAWSDFSSPTAPTVIPRNDSHVGHAVFESTSHPFMQIDAAHPTPTYSQHPSWAISKDSGSRTTTAAYERPLSALDRSSSTAALSTPIGPVATTFGTNVFPMSFRPMNFPSSDTAAMSPTSGWFPAQSDMTDAVSHPLKSPVHRPSSPLNVRRDGIRKKNARFDIPAERTLSNIDQLISQSTNEEEIKELKQQKRLLRNRQAALDSRQRKKLHTEKLEEEKKHFTQLINELEDALQNMKIREAEHLREKSEWISANQQIKQYVDAMHMERDEMIRVHTLETADLRKKNNVLKDTVEKLERQLKFPAAAVTPREFCELADMTVDNDIWGDFSMDDNHSADAGISVQPVQPSTLPDKTLERTTDYPFSWNAFYMCLLFGAFIASNGPSASSRFVPQLSDEYRAESANVLRAVLSTVVSEPSQRDNQATVATSGTAPLPTTISGAEMAGMVADPSSNLEDLHNTLVMPTEQQEQEQAFALNADQYNTLTTLDDASLDYKPQQPSNLQQALIAMRNNAVQNKMPGRATSDVYTRSALWDSVPEKVIRDFRRMVQDYSTMPVKEDGFGLL